MKRKFLEDLGLESDVVEKIMKQYGDDMKEKDTKIGTLENDIGIKDGIIEARNNKIAELEKVDVEAIKKEQFDLGKAEGSKEVEVFKKQNALDKALSQYKAKDTGILSKMLDMEKVKFNDKFEIVEGLEEQIKTLKESHDYLFDSDNPKPQFTGDIKQPVGNNQITKEVFQKMSYKDRIALKHEQPEVYQNLKNEGGI